MVPKSRGGTDALDNVVVAHAGCNKAKGNMDHEMAREWLRLRARRAA